MYEWTTSTVIYDIWFKHYNAHDTVTFINSAISKSISPAAANYSSNTHDTTELPQKWKFKDRILKMAVHLFLWYEMVKNKDDISTLALIVHIWSFTHTVHWQPVYLWGCVVLSQHWSMATGQADMPLKRVMGGWELRLCGFSEHITLAAGYKAPQFVSSFLSCQPATAESRNGRWGKAATISTAISTL